MRSEVSLRFTFCAWRRNCSGRILSCQPSSNTSRRGSQHAFLKRRRDSRALCESKRNHGGRRTYRRRCHQRHQLIPHFPTPVQGATVVSHSSTMGMKALMLEEALVIDPVLDLMFSSAANAIATSRFSCRHSALNGRSMRHVCNTNIRGCSVMGLSSGIVLPWCPATSAQQREETWCRALSRRRLGCLKFASGVGRCSRSVSCCYRCCCSCAPLPTGGRWCPVHVS